MRISCNSAATTTQMERRMRRKIMTRRRVSRDRGSRSGSLGQRHLRMGCLMLLFSITSHSSSYILWDIIQYCLADIAQWSQPGDTFTSLAQKAFNEFCDSYDDSHLIREWRNVSARAPSADDAVLNGYRKALFGNPKINVLRLQDYFIGHLLAQAKSISKEITASLRASQLSVRHRLTAYYLSQTMHLLKAYVSNTDTLTDHDTTQIGLLTDAYATLCLSKSHDESTLSAFADCCTQLRNRATPLYPDDLERALVSGGGTGSEALPAREACVACGEMVGLAGIERGVCAAGHVWTRCSATISTLGAVGLRTCTGCGRKLAAPDRALPVLRKQVR
ncbi:uncharacterized protein EV422DRAFT_433644 [Fimicolochytrium jonesii]|uniref:uncharacterized protein n=1 Tax=Fimicolochytrium jonesii TaxID=1396493 RepID=UPI0022FF42BB|nr:uncharacterized protein EV422DRAFT_433644 [Fimicolochytrium jonesii]KAI8821815.1 hypothetical protein EV422DRAFT_433644 [Fimicolochytrium jonesii]